MMKSSRITQLLLAALVDTQILNLIHFIGALGRYESPESASRACHHWADSAGQYSIRRTDLWTSTSQNPVRFCKQEAHQLVGCEVPKESAAEVCDNPEDPKGFLAGEVPEAEDSGKRWRYRRKSWSLVIPF